MEVQLRCDVLERERFHRDFAVFEKRALLLHDRFGDGAHVILVTSARSGEGKSSGGRPPTSPWGKREGMKTRHKKKASSKHIVRGRKRGKATQ